MGSFFNSKNFGDIQQLEGSGGKMSNTRNTPLARESSLYSLTFDELQGTLSGLGKDFGSVNMEDLLRNIWTAEESQAFASSSVTGTGIAPRANLQRQGSLTLPRTLSQKTVDEVWKDMFKESIAATIPTNDGRSTAGASLGPRQNTLGEMTLEEFLMRAGVAREDPQQPKPKTAGFYGALAQPCSNSTGLSIGFQPVLNQNIPGNQFLDNSNPMPNPSNMTLNLGSPKISRQKQHKEVQLQHQSIFPNEASLTFSSGVPVGNNNYQIFSPQTKVPVAAMSSSPSNSKLVQHSANSDRAAGLSALCNLPASGVAISSGNHMSSNVSANRKLDVPPASPLYAVGEDGRGRRSNSSLEKVIERRRKRMIKNRESASRSRARKQAYTLELEEELAHLKEINQELQKEQAKFMEMQKIQTLQTVKIPFGEKRRCLERALTGPW